jgi:Bacterial Ig domain/Bacterial pre-peptidase C-terminal domain/Dockerin type I domain/GEVED domain
MAVRKSRAGSPGTENSNVKAKSQARKRVRGMLLETLENRHLMAVGPQLIGIQPNNSDLLLNGAVRTEAPRELVFRFDDAQIIDAATLDGIRLTRSGGDGTFGLPSASSDFGSSGAVDIQLTSRDPLKSLTVQVTRGDLGVGALPALSVVSTVVSIRLNSNATTPTTAQQLVDAINSSSALLTVLGAKINGGFASTRLGSNSLTGFAPIVLSQSNDIVIKPGSALVGANPNENEVTVRFAEALPDDNYRIEIFGFDDPLKGIVGLKGGGQLFVPTVSGQRQETIDFRLDLGPQVRGVVPQPVVRNSSGQLQQQRDTIVVYFNNDKLLVENEINGQPKAQSAENPQFYQLYYTSDTVRNTDDQLFTPVSVKYNSVANTATLRFATDINLLAGSNADPSSFRLRIGTREAAPAPAVRSEASATAIVDPGTNGAVKLRFTAKQVGEAGNGVQVVFTNTRNGTPSVTANGKIITVDMGRDTLTAQQLVDLLRNSSASASLVTTELESGSGNTVVGNRSLSYSPVTLYGLGSSFDTSTNLGIIGSSTKLATNLVLSSAIDAQPFELDLQGASDDPAHRDLTQNLATAFENHINPAFGADDTAGITTIYYNFKTIYSTDNAGRSLVNAITEEQKQRTREALELWSKYVGVQFIETPNLGVTIATGALTGFRTIAGTRIQQETNLSFGVRIDPAFNNSLITLSATNAWTNNYGESYFRTMISAVGMILGLEHAGDLPETTLMRLDPTFLAGLDTLTDGNNAQLNASDERYEPVFPGNQDILHGQYLHRPDGTDIDLYRFEVDFGGADRVGLFTAETYAQRLTNSSALNTNIELFRQTQATGSANMGLGDSLALNFTAVRPGTQGNQLQIFFTQSSRGDNSKPTILVFPNAISIDLNATNGAESTVQDIIDAIQGSSAASKLVTVALGKGNASARVGANTLTQNPVVLNGGKFELVSQNDDYFSQDSLLKQSLTSGVYYIGVSASGNSDYNAAIANTGFGGKSQGNYELRVSFRAAVDTKDTIQDLSSSTDPAVGFDGDSDGQPGGTYDFWFETRPLQRTLSFNAGAAPAIEGKVIRIVGANGIVREFEFSSDPIVSPGKIRVGYIASTTAGELANLLASAIVGQSALGVTAVANGVSLVLGGERQITVDPSLTLIDVSGKTIFVDKLAGPNADGSLARPFNNISASGVANAFGAALPGDIVRIVGNGGVDGNAATVVDNFAYEIGSGLLAGTTLSDGAAMEVPKGVTAMVDAGAIFKLRRAAIGAGSSNLNIDRSGASLQVLGAPVLLDSNGALVRDANGNAVPGSVFFTSWLDQSIGFDTYSPETVPAAGDWGGLAFRRDVDAAAGRNDLEDEGIFLRYVSNADIRYGGGIVIVDSIQQSINPIQMLNTRPTVVDNRISFAANAAMSALPNSFEETNFNEPRFQVSGAFTSDYDRVGPEIRRNRLVNNSINGLFISVPNADSLTVPGRFDDIDVVHVITENVTVAGSPGGALLDATVPPVAAITTAATVGGTLTPGDYRYKLTFVDRAGYESIPSDPTLPQTLQINQTAISIAGLPSASGDFISRRLYRSNANGTGPYELVAVLDRSTSTYLDIGALLGGTLQRDRANVDAVTLTEVATGTLANGLYNYRIVMVDAGGREGLASGVTASVTSTLGGVRLAQLPLTLNGYVGRRIYRSANGGSGPYTLVGELLDSVNPNAATFLDNGSVLGGTLSAESQAVRRPRLSASLVIDPGTVIKLEAARIEASFGASIIAEGIDGLPVVFTSKLDDTIGAGGTFDTNNNNAATLPSPRDWGGIYMSPTSRLSIDYARIAYGGGTTKLDGTFRAFNTIEIQQAEARIAHTLFENNADGFGGQGPGTRFGRLSNAQSTIFVRGSQPTILDNEFRNNIGSAIEIDANSMIDDLKSDPGRQTGMAERNPSYIANRGPLIRQNRFLNNSLNGLEIRGDTLTTASVWDDTDIAHVVFDGIFVGNVQHEGGLRLQSAPNESLVVKFAGYGSNFNRNLGAGITANGQLTSATDRVGGTIHVLGQPGFPVILTSLKDDTVGAGLRPDGGPQNDTNNDGIGSIPQSADWRGILLDQYSNDRNVAIALETEDFTAAAPGPNGSSGSAQVLGDLAANTSESSENLRLGFTVEGVLSQDEDVDVYSFTASAGTEIWVDADYTKHNTDLVLEILDANGQLLARSDNSTAETQNRGLLAVGATTDPNSVNPMPVRTTGVRMTSGGLVKEDGTTNPLDAGLRIRLPGSPGTRSTFFFRVRSAGTDINAVSAGLTDGAYQVQVRLRENQEWAGSTVNYADIRYSMNGVHLRGLPGESPLVGEVQEDENVRNGQFLANNDVATGDGLGFGGFSFFGDPQFGDPQTGNRPQYIGNILKTSKGAISVGGTLSASNDVDFYMMDIRQEDLVATNVFGASYAPVVFDMDYADGLNRPDTSINIFRQEPSDNPFETFQYRLIYTSDSSNIADDQARPLAITDMEDLSRGSAGSRDPFIGPVALQEGTYLVGISSVAMQPRTRVLSPFDVSPVSSMLRIVDESFQAGVTTADPPVVQGFLPRTNVGPTGRLTSKTFDLSEYSAADQPAIYINYTHGGGTFDIVVNDPTLAAPVVVATTAIDPNTLDLLAGTNSLKIPLVDTVKGYNFAGKSGLSVTFRSVDPNTNVNNIIIGFAERGELNGVGNEPSLLLQATVGPPTFTRVFSLETYLAGRENPALSFDYEIFTTDLDVRVIDQFNNATLVASSDAARVAANFGAIQLTAGSPQVALLSLNRWANQRGLQVVYSSTTNPHLSTISNVQILLSDGTRVGANEPNSTYVPVAVSSTAVTTGAYQFEVRIGDNFFQSSPFGNAPTLTQSFDANDRLADQISISAPSGADITAGDKFAISDGGSSITFEFTLTGSVGLGNVAILFSSTDAPNDIARKIRDAINSPNVQSRLKVRAASTGGIATGSQGNAKKLNLFGNASLTTILAAQPAGEIQVIVHSGISDRNVRRDQAQVLIQNSFIRNSRDYGIWSEPSPRMLDPRDDISNTFFDFLMQSKPNLVGTQAVRNLLEPNDSVQGGLLPGLVIQNNVLEEGGLGGIVVQGENPIWIISPQLVPITDDNPNVNNTATHFGFFLDDRDILNIDSDRTRLRFEFEDLAGGATGGPVFGSGVVQGNGVAGSSSVAYYRDQGGSYYQRLTGGTLQPFATTAVETMHALRDAILGSMLVTNGTTQVVTATIAESLLGPDPAAPVSGGGITGGGIGGYPEYFNRPALYLEGVNNIQYLNAIGGGNPFDIRTLDLGEAPQPHARLVNNTIVGTDGRVSFNSESPTSEPNDQIQSAIQTWQGTAHNPINYVANGVIGDSPLGLPRQDVDFFQFKLGVGERALIDIDSNSGLDSVLQIFNSRGIAQSVNGATVFDNVAAPGETLGVDPYIDFTATEPGVYYAAVSSIGNTTFDALSRANRELGSTVGAYNISISALHLQDFTITAQDASAYQAGETFTIFGVPDIGNTRSSGRTFEFVFGIGGPSNPANVPINIEANWRFPDVARAIAKAINEGGAGGGPAVTNAQSLPNGIYGTASPLPSVWARPFGGLAGVLDADLDTIVGDRATVLLQFSDVNELGTNALSKREIERQLTGTFREVNQGLRLFPERNDGFLVTTTVSINGNAGVPVLSSLSTMGLGHNREETNQVSNTSLADGTTEKFVLVKNAAYIDSRGSILVDPDMNENDNLDQFFPETGILATRGASPTILNNVFFNVQSPIINEESRLFPLTFGPAPYGSNNPNFIDKPGEVIIGGSIYQYYESRSTSARFATGIETVPTNVPNTSLDLNFDIPAGVDLFVNAQAGLYLPAANSPLVDSGIDSFRERPALATVKQAVGLAVSPIIAPAYDLVGQLRVDDPAVSPPSGQGQNVFKDRGALDRADFIGPAAILLDPIDNDALGVDRDPSDSVVELNSGVFPEFRIQLADGNEPANPFLGLGIDDSTVINSIIDGLRLTGAAVVLFENGRMLQEGIDYTFAYNATRDEIILTPLAGVWKNDRVYEISINNKDRFVIKAPAGDQISDGDKFTILDQNGGTSYFEFDSGFRLQLPEGLVLQLPLAGGSFGGIADGDRVSINDGTRTFTFEFDINLNTLAGNIRVPFTVGDTRDQIAQTLVNAIRSTTVAVLPQLQSNGRIFLGAEAGVVVNTAFSAISQPSVTQAIRIPDLGHRPGGITDGQTFVLSDGRRSVTFEYDDNGSFTSGNFVIDIAGLSTQLQVATATLSALASSPINIDPVNLGNGLIYLGLSPSGTAFTGNSALTLVGVARTIADGQTFTISNGALTKTFEFTRDGTVVGSNIPVNFTVNDNLDQIGNRLSLAIANAGLSLAPIYIGGGNIAVGGTTLHAIDTTLTPSLGLFGKPGVESNTKLQVFGSLIMTVPSGAGSSLVDGQTFTITNNGITAVFEFDNGPGFPSQPGNIVVRYTAQSTAQQIASSIALAVQGAGLGLSPTTLTGGRIALGVLQLGQVNVGISGLTLSRGVINDSESFTISNGSRTVTFEFENVDIGNGFVSGRVPILFGNNSTPDTVAQSMKAAIESAGLGLTTTVIPGGILQLNDSPQYTISSAQAPNLIQTGVPGGANAVRFIQDASFTSTDVKLSIIEAINASAGTPLHAADRGGATLFVENATAISSDLENFFIRGVADVAGNLLKPNRINNETQFTILMPGVTLDYGDTPDPLNATPGRYPTRHENNGARHVIGPNQRAVLGPTITADADGIPTPMADGDTDDGITFVSPTVDGGAIFNRNILTTISATLSTPGYLDAWIDFNADGDWDDPGEQILRSEKYTLNGQTRSFNVTVPATSPIPAGRTTTFARFRSSSVGGLQATGLAVDGEVEDYAVVLVPGTPPTAVNDTYGFNEDTTLTTTDPTGTLSPGFLIDDGVAANDQDPEGGPFGVTLLSLPAHSSIFDLASNGLLTYRAQPDFFGIDTFTYRVNDGVLNSANIATVTIIVGEVNDAPVGVVDPVTVDEDQVTNLTDSQLLARVTAGPVNESAQTLRITGVTPVSDRGGTVSIQSGRVVYTPPSNFAGPDRFTITVTDNGTTNGLPAPLSTQFVVNINVLDVNDVPTTVVKNASTDEDTPLTFTTGGLMAGDLPGPANESSQTLTFKGVIATSTNGGTVTLSGSQVTYTPPKDFVGDDTFFYEVIDDGLSGTSPDPKTGTGTVIVRVDGINDAPVVQTPLGTVTVLEDDPTKVIDLNGVFFDPDVIPSGDALQYSIESISNTGLVTGNIVGNNLNLQLSKDKNGSAVIVLVATDSAPTPLSVKTTFTLSVTAVNDPPQLVGAIPDLTVAEDSGPHNIVLTPTYFFDADADVLQYTVSNSNVLLVTPTVTNGVLRLTLGSNRSGTSVLTVQAADGSGQVVSDTFTLTVTSVNDAPLTVAESYTVPRGTTYVTTDARGVNASKADDGVLANDSDPEGASITARLVTSPSFAASFTLNTDGTFTYVHNGLSSTTDTFTYQASDGTTLSAITTVTLTIGAAPPPVHQNPLAVTVEDANTGHRDVNADGFISPIDALLVISFLNTNGPRPVAGLPAPPPYRDVNGDNNITAIDALLIIDHLNRRGRTSGAGGEGEGLTAEGESAVASLMAPIVVSRTVAVEPLGVQPVDVSFVLPNAEGESAEDFFAEVGVQGLQMVDTSWADDDREEDREIPIDLALAGLLPDVGENGPA